MLAVYKLQMDLYYGALYGVFVADEEDVKYLIEEKVNVYFGEVAGKYSEVYVPIENGDVEKVSNKKEVVDFVREHNLEFGYDPFEQSVYCEDDDEDENPDSLDFGEWTVYDYIRYKRDGIIPEE